MSKKEVTRWLSVYLLVMYPSLGSARFGSVLARAFKEKARLGSARYLFEKARFLKNAQNEPKINYEAYVFNKSFFYNKEFLKIIVIA